MKHCCFLAILYLFLTTHAFSQKIKVAGSVFNEAGESLPNTSITASNLETDEILTYTITNLDGSFSLEIEDKPPFTLVLEVRHLNYSGTYEQIPISKDGEAVYLDIILKKLTRDQLKPVYIVAENRGIKVRRDTTTYSIEKFRDGTEQTVEDVLKNLPGIEVFDDGKIQYKGRDIAKVLLEGDDLFENNYTIGTKNISVDLVEQIEAIERYSENPLLRNIEFTDKIALNLKLKEGQTDFSGNATLGVGHESRYYANATGLAISKKAKNFSNLHYNNIGENTSPYNIFSNTISLDDLAEEDYTLLPILDKQISNSLIKSENLLQNDNFYGSSNQIVNLSNKVALRVNASYFQDRLRTQTTHENLYFTPNDTITFFQNSTVVARPNIWNADYKLAYNTSKKSLLEINGKINRIETENRFDFTFNNQPENRINNNGTDIFLKQNIEYTHKLNDKQVVQAKSVFFLNENPEEDLYKLPITIDSLPYSQQNIYQNKKGYVFNLSFVGAGDKVKYSSTVAFNNIYNWFSSNLSDVTSGSESILNNLKLEDYGFTFENSLSYYLKKWLFRVNLASNYLNLELEQNNENSRLNKFIINPDLTIKHSFSEKINLEGNYFYEALPLTLDRLYSNSILLNNTSITKNKIRLSTLRSQQAQLRFSYYDVYNSFGISSRLAFRENFNPITPTINIFPTFTESIYLLIDVSNKRYSLDVSSEKLVYDISSKFKLNYKFSLYKYNNFVQNSILRNNELKSHSLVFEYISAFGGIFNFNNNFNYTLNNTSNDLGKVSNSFVINETGFVLKPSERLYTKLNFDIYIPDATDLQETFTLSKLEINYTQKNKKIDYSLIANNITDEEEFQRFFVSDFNITSNSQTIVPFNFIFKVSFRF